MSGKLLSAIFGALVLVSAVEIQAAEVTILDQPPQAVTVRNVKVQDGAVSGEVVNSSPNVIRDLQLLIRYTWLWKNEMKPGEDNRSDAVFYNVDGETPPGGSKPFTYRPSSSMKEDAGRYEVSVKVAGFTQLVPVKR
ncbi:MAG TPA: hypothetical protein VI231_10270 [Candidatus Binatia bacterium]|jgi:hypothetical protein